MKIIISPSKTQNFKKELIMKTEVLDLPKKTIFLFDTIRALSKKELGKALEIKNSLLDKTYELYQKPNHDLPYIRAIDCYTGVVFEKLDNDCFNQNQRYYLNDRLIILSAMYGALKPDSIINPYRLDMTAKLKNINLYDYWKDTIKTVFENEDIIINLASNEFSRLLKGFEKRMINIDFYEVALDGKLKIVSYNAKKARGMMVNSIVKNLVSNVEDLKKIEIGHYKYSNELSNQNNLKFISTYKA